MEKNKEFTLIIVFSLGIIGWLETLALIKGVNGIIFASSMGGIGTILGWAVKAKIFK